MAWLEVALDCHVPPARPCPSSHPLPPLRTDTPSTYHRQTLTSFVFTAAGAYQMAIWAQGKHKRLVKVCVCVCVCVLAIEAAEPGDSPVTHTHTHTHTLCRIADV